jgi:hypothetical protein
VLVTVPVRGVDVRRDFYLVNRQGAYLGPAARAFHEVAKETRA